MLDVICQPIENVGTQTTTGGVVPKTHSADIAVRSRGAEGDAPTPQTKNKDILYIQWGEQVFDTLCRFPYLQSM